MFRRCFLFGLLASATGCTAGDSSKEFERPWPPRPAWVPSFQMPFPKTLTAFKLALRGPRDIVVFKNGTMVIVPLGMDDSSATDLAKAHLNDLVHGHVDMSVQRTAAEDVLVSYNRTGYEAAFNLVLSDIAQEHWNEIETRHLDGLVADEVIVTQVAANGFDEEGKMALLGRAYMFLDALDPQVMLIDRASTN